MAIPPNPSVPPKGRVPDAGGEDVILNRDRATVPARVRQLLRLPQYKTPLRAECVRAWAEDGMHIEDIRFESEPGQVVPAYVVRPSAGDGPWPAIICLHGTNGTREELIDREFVPDPPPRRGWARRLASHGFLTLSIDQRGFAARRGNIVVDASIGLLFGRPYMGQLVWDVVRAVDYLSERPDVDASRIACTGFSLGGGVTLYALPAEPRLAAGAPMCGGVGSYRTLLEVGSPHYHSVYFYPPDFFAYFPGDQAEMLAGVAPRALRIYAREEDVGMPAQAVRALEADLRRVYEEAGAAHRFSVSLTPGGHAMSPEMIDDVGRWLASVFGLNA